MADTSHDHRLIIEKGVYRPVRGGKTLPPMRRHQTDNGELPAAGGPSISSTKPVSAGPASNAGSKK